MTTYRIVAAVNTAPGHFDGYTPGDRIAAVTSRRGAVGPIVFAIDAYDAAAALEAMWVIGNRVADDRGGRCWPADVRSLSTGDVLAVFAPGYPLESQRVDTYAVAPTGFDLVPAPDPSAWVPVDGCSARYRPAADPSGPSASVPSPDGAPSGGAQL